MTKKKKRIGMNTSSKHILMLFFTLFSIAQAAGQQKTGNTILTGKIIDEDSNAPVEFASVALIHPMDSSIIRGNTSKANGTFALPAAPGKYRLRIDFVSYKTKFSPIIEVKKGQKSLNLGNIVLSVEAELLEAIEVRGEKSRMEFKLDKKVFNVGKDIASAGGSATDVLENIPAVAVDIEGNVSLRGSESVRILIDGRPSGLAGISGSDALKQLSAEMIEKIEVVTNPSVRYEAEGEAGVINIVLKKNKGKGINGGIQASAGFPFNNSLSANLNYRTKKVNYFGSLGFRHYSRIFNAKNYRENYFETYTKIIDQNTDFDRTGVSGNIRLGADYKINDKNSLTGSMLYRYGVSTNNATVNTDYLSSGALDSLGVRKTEEEETEPNYDFTLMYKKKYDKKGKSLTSDVRYSKSREEEGSDIFEQFYFPDTQPTGNPIIQKNNTRENQESFTFQLDYVNPIFEKGSMEAGVRSSYRNTGNNFLVENRMSDGQWVADTAYSNDFVYIEKIQAAYAMVGNKIINFSYQLGIRYEYTDVATTLKETADENNKKYSDFFPSAHLTYAMKGDNALQLSYSRRVRRPRSRELNPFNNFINSESIRTGNPNLNPEYTTSLELGNLKNFEKGNIYGSFYLRHSENVIQRISETTVIGSDTINLSYPKNLSDRLSYGIEFSVSQELKAWWRTDASFNYFFQQYNDPIYGNEGTSWRATWNNNFYTKPLDFQTMISYRGPSVTAQGERDGIFYFDIAASREIMKKKGTLSLRVRDVFNSRKYSSVSTGEDFYSESVFRRRSQSILVSLSYRINQKNFKKRKSNGSKNRNSDDGGGFDF